MPDDATSYAIADDQNTLPNARKAVGGRDSSSLVSFLAGSLGRLEGASARAERSAQEADTMKPPELHEPVQPPEQQTDPIMSFGQPAVWLAAFGSLLTRQPLTTAINAAASAMQATRGQDFEIAKHNMEVWRTQSENAIKLAKFQQDAYKSVIDKAGKDANVASALARTTGAAFKDAPALMVLETEGLEGFKRFLKVRGKQTAAMESGSADFTKHVDAQTKIAEYIASGDPNKQADAMDMMAAEVDRLQKGKGSSADSRTKAFSLGIHYRSLAAALRSGDRTQIDGAQKDASQIPEIGARILTPSSKPGQQKSGLTGEALDKQAEYFHVTHQLPPGFGGMADREAIMNREAEMFPRGGDAGDSGTGQAQRQATYKALTTTLSTLTKQQQTAQAYERSAAQELDYAVSLLPKEKAPLDSQLLTRWLRTGETQFGDVEVPQYMAALISGLDEYAKVLEGSTGSVARSTDASRSQAVSLIPPGATTDQIPGVVHVLKQGMNFKVTSYGQQIAQVGDQIGGLGGRGGGAQGADHPDNDPDGTVRSQGGVKYRKTNGQWLPVAGTE